MRLREVDEKKATTAIRHQNKAFEGNILEEVVEVDEVDEEENCDKKSGSGNELVQEVKYCSRVQFRAPDIIEL